jgi:hypothetical protein
MEKFIKYNGEEASQSYVDMMKTVRKKGYNTFWEYLKGEGHYEIKDEWRIKTVYEDKDELAIEIPDIPGYYITPFGKIWKHSPKLKGWIMLSQQAHKSGYMAFQPYIDGKRKVKYVHRTLLSAFYGPRDASFEGHHIDADRHNNTLDNLVWMDKAKHRRMPKQISRRS